jgi:hypothetical protein
MEGKEVVELADPGGGAGVRAVLVGVSVSWLGAAGRGFEADMKALDSMF